MSRATGLLIAIALLGGCNSERATDESTAGVRVAPASQAQSAAESRDIAVLRRVTAPFHDFTVATAAGWSAQITPCMASPDGGMGFHYGNTSIIDGSVSVEAPELLLYEPQPGGKLNLVAVEYIVPYTAHSRSAAPPVLFGHQFKRNDVFKLWGLHVWVWKENPNGTFANWNPLVSCQNTTQVSNMAHD
ncbi:MAG: hypothetical protein ABJD11_09350 [Gemmatimonadota bacterium]